MSRVGKRKLLIPENTVVTIRENQATVKGKLGTLSLNYSPLINVILENNEVKTFRLNEEKSTKQLHGTTNSLLNNMILGVNQGFKKVVEINGVGYRALLQGEQLILNVGYSHPITINIPQDLKVILPKPTEIEIMGIDKQKVGELAAIIRKVRPPSVYSGKGIKYKDEVIRRKEGKAAKK